MNNTAPSDENRLIRRAGEPVVELHKWLSGDLGADSLLVVDFDFYAWWLEDTPVTRLSALYLYHNGELACSVTDEEIAFEGEAPARQYQAWLDRFQLYSAVPGEALPLKVTAIPKPWGQELWYTGVEQRGVCAVGDGQFAVPIPWLQAVMPDNGAGRPGEPLVLLKVLDPAPAEVTGDLYFELHEEKREVYVVTHVDEAAWPGGTGYIRYGFDPAKIAAAGSEEEFRARYLAAVRAYESVRRAIDALAPGAAPEASLLEEEVSLRRRMEGFTHMRPLRVGDVVVVPLRMPHSLQHGVRTIEFQTPVYERKILSFAQKVLTQDHWDTSTGVDVMRLQPPDTESFESLCNEGGVSRERIVDFEDFEVHRLRFAPGASHALPALEHYSLLMTVEGHCPVGQLVLGPEEAAILPARGAVELRSQDPGEPLVVLLAIPRH